MQVYSIDIDTEGQRSVGNSVACKRVLERPKYADSTTMLLCCVLHSVERPELCDVHRAWNK